MVLVSRFFRRSDDKTRQYFGPGVFYNEDIYYKENLE